MAARVSRSRSLRRPASYSPTGYLEQTRGPLLSLVFLLPMLIVYEVAVFMAYPPFSKTQPPEVMAKVLLSWVMALLGISGYYLPGLIVVLTLLGWHLYRKEPWRVDKGVLFGMAVESVLFALPPLLFHFALTNGIPLASSDWAESLLLSISAGIYEELVFRLILISLIVFVLADVFGLKLGPGELAAVLISSIIFAGHHYKGFGGSFPFDMPTFIFRALAGVYLAGVFVLRGFGIAAGCHIVYDLIVVSFY